MSTVVINPYLVFIDFFFSQPVPLSILKSSILSKKQNKQANKNTKTFLNVAFRLQPPTVSHDQGKWPSSLMCHIYKVS